MKWDKLKETIRINKKIVIFLIGMTLIGIILGSLFITLINDNDKTMTKEYMNNFLNQVQTNKILITQSFINDSIKEILFLILIWLLGISIIGIPIILFMYFSKAFILGFSISSFILTLKAKGCILSFIYIIPYSIIQFIIYIVLMNYAITLSIKLIESFFRKKTIDFKNVFKKYTMILTGSVLIMLCINLYQVLIVPELIKLFLPVIK